MANKDTLQPIVADIIKQMQGLGKTIDGAVKPYGFALLVFPLGKPGRVNYISNADRKTMLVAMQEFIDRHGAQPYDGALPENEKQQKADG